MKHSFFRTLLATAVATLALVSYAQFVDPQQNPPSGNVSAPLNTGGIPQVKQGNLGVMGLHISSSNPGTPAPGYLLDVAGPASFGSLITANARVTQIAASTGTVTPVCVNPAGDLGLCGTPAQGMQVTLTATPASITSGQTSTLAWSSTPAAVSCTATAGSGFSTGGAASGTDATATLTSTTTYTVSCTDSAGAVATASATVTVIPPVGSITVDAALSIADYGQPVTFSWNTNGLTGCSATGHPTLVAAFNASQASGSRSLPITSPTVNLSVSCGAASDSATVTRRTPDISLNLGSQSNASGSCTTIPEFTLANVVQGYTPVPSLQHLISQSGGTNNQLVNATWTQTAPRYRYDVSSGTTNTLSIRLRIVVGQGADQVILDETFPVTWSATSIGCNSTSGSSITLRANNSSNNISIISGAAVELRWFDPTLNLTSCTLAARQIGTIGQPAVIYSGMGPLTVNPLSSTEYTVNCTDDNQQTLTDTITATVNMNYIPLVRANNSTQNISITEGSSVSLTWPNTPTSSINYLGTQSCTNNFGGAAIANNANQTITLSPQQTTQYSITCTSTTGVVRTDNIVVTVVPPTFVVDLRINNQAQGQYTTMGSPIALPAGQPFTAVLPHNVQATSCQLGTVPGTNSQTVTGQQSVTLQGGLAGTSQVWGIDCEFPGGITSSDAEQVIFQ
jgi:hypothetical protein